MHHENGLFHAVVILESLRNIISKMKYRLLSVISVAILTWSGAMAQQKWTLRQCIDYAMEHNLQILQSQNSIESAEVDVKQAKSQLFPSLTFSSQQMLGFQKVETQNYGSFDSKATNPSYNGSYGLQGNLTLYNGGSNINSLRQSRLSLQAQQLENEKTANDIVIRLIQAYYQVLYAHESVLTNEEIVKVSEKELERTQARLAVGKSSKVDVAQMESQLQQNRYQLTQAAVQEAENLLTLKQLLQLTPDSAFEVEIAQFSDDDVLSLIPSVAESEQMAIANLPNMKAADLRVKSSEMQVKIAKGSYLPTVSLNAGVTTGNGNIYQGSFGQQVTDHLNSSVGLSVQVPIYDRRQTRSSVDKAKIQLSNTLLEQENTLLDLQNTIASVHLDIESAQSRYRSAVASEEAARQSFEMMDERYGVGLESLIDLLTEKNNYLRAKQETLQSKYTSLLNQELLKCYTGQER